MKRFRIKIPIIAVLLLALIACGKSEEEPEEITPVAAEVAAPETVVSQPEVDEETAFEVEDEADEPPVEEIPEECYAFSLAEVPEYSGETYYVINENQPNFFADDMTTNAFEEYSALDSLGRCGVCYANVCQELMPTEPRGEIGNVKPSGWHTVKYPEVIEKLYLYNRCHLLGYQLTGENDNVQNLITGTRYFNEEGMLPFENKVANYVASTGNHVLYRVTPVYEEDNLIASGVTMEAKSVEDDGKGICFYVFVYNVQPGILIDYASGESMQDPEYTNLLPAVTETKPEEKVPEKAPEVTEESKEVTYVLNTNTGKFHEPWCGSVDTIKPKNRSDVTDSREDIINRGYAPCKRCNP